MLIGAPAEIDALVSMAELASCGALQFSSLLSSNRGWLTARLDSCIVKP